MKRLAAWALALIMILSLFPATVWAADTTVEYKGTKHYIAEDELGITNDELFEAYAQREFDAALGIEAPSFYRTSALEAGTLEKEIYDKLRAELAKVAAGAVTSTEITVSPTKAWSKSDLGVTEFVSGNVLTEATDAAIEAKLKLVYTCLLADCPLEMYWHDKTAGMATLPFSCSISGDNLSVTSITYQFAVATDYSATGAAETFATNINKTGATSTAVTNAQAIVAANASKSDLEKLAAYKDKICELVSYDTSAAASSPSVEGINPWQMIYVFDGDEDSNVVCEGYAKAFQFLCDLSSTNTMECHTVTGTMSGGTGAGRHMWNVVTMDDGRNYLVDVTNCDDGTIGAPDKLFMAYTTNSADENQTHTFTIDSQKITFTYDETMEDLFCEGYLDLATTAYKHSSAVSASLYGSSAVQAGTDVTLTLKVSGTNIMGVEATLEYDEDVLEYRSYHGLLEGWDVVPNGTKFVMYGVKDPINEASDVVSVTFRVKSGTAVGAQLSVAFKDITVSDGNADSTVGMATWSGTVTAAPATSPIAYIYDKPDIKYTTVQDAVDAAENGDIVRMLDDFILSEATLTIDKTVSENVTISKNITFDLGGYKFDLEGGTIVGDFTFQNGSLNLFDASCVIKGSLSAGGAIVNIKGGTITGNIVIEEGANCSIWAGSFPSLQTADVKSYLVADTPFYPITVTASPSVEGANWPIEVPSMFWLTVAVSGGASVVTNDGCFVECKTGVTATFTAESGNDEYYDCRISGVGYSGLASGDNLVTVSQENGATTFTMCPKDIYSGVLPVGGNINVKYRAIPHAITAAVDENGSFSLPDSAIADELVTITTAPNNGYEVASITITKTEDGTDITDSVNLAGSPNTYTFVMPNEPVTVSVKYCLSEIAISEENFPDANFRNYVADNFDTDGDGVLSTAERGAVTIVDCMGLNISSLTGIEHFAGLKKLYCSGNKLTSLDMSSNPLLEELYCDVNQLTFLDVSKNPALNTIWCEDNKLTSLDVSENLALKELYCHFNDITFLDVSKNTALKYLECYFNELTSLDVSNNLLLEELYCYYNDLTSLNVSKNVALKALDFCGNDVSEIDVSNNKFLELLNCGGNALTEIDVTQNSALKTLGCDHLQIRSLNVSKNLSLKRLFCGNTNIDAIDVSKNLLLTELWCNENNLTNLDIKNNSQMRSLWCFGNQLTSLDISGNPMLMELVCYDNRLQSLDVSKNPMLYYLDCGHNQLTSLDLSANAELLYLEKNNNSLSVILDENKQFDLSTLPGNFDVSKASNWTNGTVSGTILTATDTNLPVTYDYDCGNGYAVSFTLYLETEISVTLGDANGDGTIDIGDHQRLFEHLQGIDVITDATILAAVDVNKDGVIDIGDHQRLFEHLQGIDPLK